MTFMTLRCDKPSNGRSQLHSSTTQTLFSRIQSIDRIPTLEDLTFRKHGHGADQRTDTIVTHHTPGSSESRFCIWPRFKTTLSLSFILPLPSWKALLFPTGKSCVRSRFCRSKGSRSRCSSPSPSELSSQSQHQHLSLGKSLITSVLRHWISSDDKERISISLRISGKLLKGTETRT